MSKQYEDCRKQLAELTKQREELASMVASLEEKYKLLNPRVKDLEKREQDLSRRIKDMEPRAEKAETTLATLSKEIQRLLDIGLSLEELAEFSQRVQSIAQRHHITPAELRDRLLQELETLDQGLGLEALIQSRQQELEKQEQSSCRGQTGAGKLESGCWQSQTGKDKSGGQYQKNQGESERGNSQNHPGGQGYDQSVGRGTAARTRRGYGGSRPAQG